MDDWIIKQSHAIAWGTFPAWESFGAVLGFTCRMGGESSIVTGTLNMALHVGDTPEKVLRNRRKAAEAIGFPLGKSVTCAQVHSSHIAVVTANDAGRGAFSYEDTIPNTDGLMTKELNLPLMLFYADCTPVVLLDTQGPAIAVLHAGWRGSVGKIAKKGVLAMQEVFGCHPKNLLAGIGPSIGPCCYEVDQAVRRQAAGYENCFKPNGEGHYLLDLWQLNTIQLLEAGIPAEHIYQAACCTKCHQDLFFSYRGEQGRTGRLAAILMRKA